MASTRILQLLLVTLLLFSSRISSANESGLPDRLVATLVATGGNGGENNGHMYAWFRLEDGSEIRVYSTLDDDKALDNDILPVNRLKNLYLVPTAKLEPIIDVKDVDASDRHFLEQGVKFYLYKRGPVSFAVEGMIAEPASRQLPGAELRYTLIDLSTGGQAIVVASFASEDQDLQGYLSRSRKPDGTVSLTPELVKHYNTLEALLAFPALKPLILKLNAPAVFFFQ